MSKYIVAVSGGVDSVVLLHKLVAAREHEIIVAHFDHGIRSESSTDARFVEALAGQYNLPFEGRREELGAQASEALARERRYAFLYEVAAKHRGVIVTAHHCDDILETIAINLTRGTGWRGLAAFSNNEIVVRPQLGMTKNEIYLYALEYNLEWVEDETNATDAYLRNRLRKKLAGLSVSKRTQLTMLRKEQCLLRREIEAEEKNILDSMQEYSRYFFTHIDVDVALELLRAAAQFRITYPQAERGLHAIKTLPAGAASELGGGVRLKLSQRAFTIQTL